jgi:hypothetical protein
MDEIKSKKDLWKVYSRTHEIFGNGDGKRLENLSWRLMALENKQSPTIQSRFSAPSSIPSTPTSASTIPNAAAAMNVHVNEKAQVNGSGSGSGEMMCDLFCYNCKTFKSEMWHKSTTVPLIILCNQCLNTLYSMSLLQQVSHPSHSHSHSNANANGHLQQDLHEHRC